MHTLTTNPRVLHLYLPWLAAMLAAALELEGVHRLRRILFGVHPIPAGVRWLLLCGLAMCGAIGLSYTLIYFARALHVPARGYWLPWIVYFGYMVVVAERERRSALAALVIDQED